MNRHERRRARVDIRTPRAAFAAAKPEEDKVTKPKRYHITITLVHCIDGGTGRVESKRHAKLRGHDEAAFAWLQGTVRGYRGPTQAVISEAYARKIHALAVAAGFSVEVKERPKPTAAAAMAALAFVRAALPITRSNRRPVDATPPTSFRRSNEGASR
jgi:hypothetical protein